jgi:hypothetical protein
LLVLIVFGCGCQAQRSSEKRAWAPLGRQSPTKPLPPITAKRQHAPYQVLLLLTSSVHLFLFCYSLLPRFQACTGLSCTYLYSRPSPTSTCPAVSLLFGSSKQQHASRGSASIPLPAILDHHLDEPPTSSEYPYEWQLLYSYHHRPMIPSPKWQMSLAESL